MRQAFTAIFLAFILLALPISESAQQQQPQQDQEAQKSGQSLIVKVNLVDVLATVLNRRNKLHDRGYE